MQNCQGLRRGRLLHGLLLGALSSLIFWLLGGLLPGQTAKLLQHCSLQHAEYVLVTLLDGRSVLLRVDIFQVQNKVYLPRPELEDGPFEHHARDVRGFRLFMQTFLYNETADLFERVPGMPRHLPTQICTALNTLQQIDASGADWKTFNTRQWHVRSHMMHLYGTKRNLIPFNMGFHLASEGRAIRFVLMLQWLQMAYLIYRRRYIFPILIPLCHGPAVAAIMFGHYQRHRKVMALMNHCRLTPMVQQKWVRAIASWRLVPGDVVVLQPGRATCDMVLLQGACLVTESMLTGEATQIRKAGYLPDPGEDYNPDYHQYCTIYAGTVIQQVWNPQNAEEEVLVMVCRTGMHTALGKMISQLLMPGRNPPEKHPFLPDIWFLCLYAYILQLLILVPYMVKASAHHQTRRDIIKVVADLIMLALPPGLPVIMLVVGAIGRARLMKLGMLLKSPEILKQGAAVDVVCFDKTGTLTRSVAALHGVVPVHRAGFTGLHHNALRWSNRLKQAFAVCHSLNAVSKTVVAGLDIERSLFKTVEARFLDRDTVVLPRRPDPAFNSSVATLSILKVLEFKTETLRSGAVVLSSDAPAGSALLFLKGAPGVIAELVDRASIPDDFSQVTDEYSSKSFRLLAVAAGIIANRHSLDLLRMTQQQIEANATDMRLLGLVVLTNSVREDSTATIHQLQDGGGIRTMMITGDYHHTAIAVARDVGMLKPQGQVVIIDCASQRKLHRSVRRPQMRRDTSIAHSLLQGSGSSHSADATNPPDDALQAQVQHARHELEHAPIRKQVSWAPMLSGGQMQNHHHPLPDSSAELAGLRFMTTEGRGHLNAADALSALAEGQMQCAVTGAAFERLLQRCNLSAIQTVMQSAVVFSRMQPQQKGEVMDLLSMRGIHRLVEGCPRHIAGLGNTTMFCGDGINDLAALSAANIGMSIAGADAVIAAELCTSQGSVAGVCGFIKLSKASHAIVICLFKYMVVYQAIVAEAAMTVFFVDGSTLSSLQYAVLDFQAMALGIACCWVEPLQHMTRRKPPPLACTFQGFTLMTATAISVQLCQSLTMLFLCTRPWFSAGTGNAHLNPVVSLAWLVTNLQLLIPLLSQTIGIHDYSERLIHTRLILGVMILHGVLSYLCVLICSAHHVGPLHLFDFAQSFRLQLAGVIVAVSFAHIVVVNSCRRVLQFFAHHRVRAA